MHSGSMRVVPQPVCKAASVLPVFLFADGLFSSFCHFLCKGLFAILADVTDAGRSVTPENECEDLANKIIVKAAFLNVNLALGTSMETLFHTTLVDLAHLRPLVKGPA